MRHALSELSYKIVPYVVFISCLVLGAQCSKAAVFVCKNTTQLPISVGVGSNEKEAWTKMIENCVYEQQKEYKNREGVVPNEDRYVLMIDACINRQCTQMTKEEQDGKR